MQQLPVLHWINKLLIQKFTLQWPIMPLLFKNYSLVEVTYLLIRFSKINYFSETQRILTEMVSEQKAPHREKKITLARVSVNDTPIFTNPSIFVGKFWILPPLWKTFENSNPPPFKKGVRVPIMTIKATLLNDSHKNWKFFLFSEWKQFSP